jgi:hypothetical protein
VRNALSELPELMRMVVEGMGVIGSKALTFPKVLRSHLCSILK